jgi:hypothetical protein
MAKTTLKCVKSHMPSKKKSKYWVTQRRLILHAARYWDLIIKGIIKKDEITWVLHSLTNLYSDQGKMAETEKMYQRALQKKEKA